MIREKKLDVKSYRIKMSERRIYISLSGDRKFIVPVTSKVAKKIFRGRNLPSTNFNNV